jgi:hypothetical protein
MYCTLASKDAVSASSVQTRFGLPEPDSEVVHTFYPLLAGSIMEAQMRSDDEGDTGSGALPVLSFEVVLSQGAHLQGQGALASPVLVGSSRVRRDAVCSCMQHATCAVCAGEPEAPDEALIGLLIKHEVVRRVTQVPTAYGNPAGQQVQRV